MNKTNVQDSGHLLEQPTKVHNIRYELAVFHSYTFIRRSNTVIEVWMPEVCECCGKDVRLSGHFVRTASATDDEIKRHGLKPFEGPCEPLCGSRPHTASPIMCNPCRNRWLKGEALETLGYTSSRSLSWN